METKPHRHVGGALLPSAPPPWEHAFKNGALYVAIEKGRDTHTLRYRHHGFVSEIAEHPNGHSCAELGRRMVAGDEARIREQVDYILQCGGMARHPDHVVHITVLIIGAVTT